MSRRVPIVSTVLVLLAAGIMVALGFWQWGRAQERDAMKRDMVQRGGLPEVAYPYAEPSDAAILYRKVAARCVRVLGWQMRVGRSVDDRTGWRHIATCAAPVAGVRFMVDMGTSLSPGAAPRWTGGDVTGHAVREPSTLGVWDRLSFKRPSERLMVVAETPAPGLTASRQPDPGDEPNSSWSYMVQWFGFATTALVIYVLALRKRWRSEGR